MTCRPPQLDRGTPVRLLERPAPAAAVYTTEPVAALAGGVINFLRLAQERVAALSAGNPPIPQAAFRVLRALPARRAVLARGLAQSLRLDKGHMSRLVHTLMQEGLIAPDLAARGRGTPLRITGKGRALRRREKLLRVEAVSGLLKHLDGRERRLLRTLLEKPRA